MGHCCESCFHDTYVVSDHLAEPDNDAKAQMSLSLAVSHKIIMCYINLMFVHVKQSTGSTAVVQELLNQVRIKVYQTTGLLYLLHYYTTPAITYPALPSTISMLDLLLSD